MGSSALTLGGVDRVTAERHGAIRVGTAEELNQVGRIFAAMGVFTSVLTADDARFFSPELQAEL